MRQRRGRVCGGPSGEDASCGNSRYILAVVPGDRVTGLRGGGVGWRGVSRSRLYKEERESEDEEEGVLGGGELTDRVPLLLRLLAAGVFLVMAGDILLPHVGRNTRDVVGIFKWPAVAHDGCFTYC